MHQKLANPESSMYQKLADPKISMRQKLANPLPPSFPFSLISFELRSNLSDPLSILCFHHSFPPSSPLLLVSFLSPTHPSPSLLYFLFYLWMCGNFFYSHNGDVVTEARDMAPPPASAFIPFFPLLLKFFLRLFFFLCVFPSCLHPSFFSHLFSSH